MAPFCPGQSVTCVGNLFWATHFFKLKHVYHHHHHVVVQVIVLCWTLEFVSPVLSIAKEPNFERVPYSSSPSSSQSSWCMLIKHFPVVFLLWFKVYIVWPNWNFTASFSSKGFFWKAQGFPAEERRTAVRPFVHSSRRHPNLQTCF